MRWIITTCLAVSVFVSAMAISRAQDATPAAPPPNAVTVPVGPYDFPVNGDEPLTACVVSRSEDLEGVYVGVQVLIRGKSGDYVPVAAFDTRATAALKDAHTSDCFVLVLEK